MRIFIAMMALLTAGCSHVGRESVTVAAPAAPAVVVAAAPVQAPVVIVAPGPPPAPVVNAAPVVAAVTVPSPIIVTPAVVVPRVAEVAAPAAPAVPVANAAASAPAVVLPPKQEAVVPAVKAPLDLKTLESKLKETRAIGVFTKLSLKNQVDDLLAQFRAFYQGQRKITLAELRQPYDLLLMKLLSLLQNDDPALAREIATSREAIWGILADPVKFATL